MAVVDVHSSRSEVQNTYLDLPFVNFTDGDGFDIKSTLLYGNAYFIIGSNFNERSSFAMVLPRVIENDRIFARPV